MIKININLNLFVHFGQLWGSRGNSQGQSGARQGRAEVSLTAWSHYGALLQYSVPHFVVAIISALQHCKEMVLYLNLFGAQC